LGVDGRIGEEDTVGVVGDVAAVQEFHGVPSANICHDDPGIGLIEALIRRSADLTVWVGD
jgi:hypothetical protein